MIDFSIDELLELHNGASTTPICRYVSDLLDDMIAVEALREGLTPEEWMRKYDEKTATKYA
jgi:hypothetical protein